MPRPAPPLTPLSSTEIKSRDGAGMGLSQASFELPPAAFDDSRPSSADTRASSGSSYSPGQSPKMTSQPRKRSSVATPAVPKDQADFALPLPPTRARKIIQMKPKGQKVQVVAEPDKAATGKKGAAGKKQPSTTSAAGRKIARKTAHSLIERRRRSKMNEEFGVLKNMIPACTGEMHKLAILQASIDYVRYLEDCIKSLKAQSNQTRSNCESTDFPTPPAARRNNYDDGEDTDVEMSNSQNPSPAYTHPVLAPHQQSISPVMLPQDTHHYRQPAPNQAVPPVSEAFSQPQGESGRHYSYSSSTTTSPAFGPRRWDYAGSVASIGSALTSPALLPQSDHEATTALLMLGADRRGTLPALGSGERARGMSVKDLLM